MKVKVTFKNSDAVDRGIDEAIASEKLVEALTEDDLEDMSETEDSVRGDLRMDLSKWVSYNEYITIEFDTEAETATVLEV